ncbi:hypothetical protein L9F63_015595, partial [Diploptera punctata]
MGNTIEQWRASIGYWTRGHVLQHDGNSKATPSPLWYLLSVVLVLLVIGGVELNPGPVQRFTFTLCDTCHYFPSKGNQNKDFNNQSNIADIQTLGVCRGGVLERQLEAESQRQVLEYSSICRCSGTAILHTAYICTT